MFKQLFSKQTAPSGVGRPHQARRQGHVDGVEATSHGLVRATVGSAIAAGAILVFTWLPAEYGIDPTGVGKILGLTEMGEIKQQLYAEAEAEDAAQAAAAGTGVAQRLDAIEAQVAAIAAAVGAEPVSDATLATKDAEPAPASADDPEWRHEVSRTLAPDEGVEIKLAMDEGETAEFEWSAKGAVLNHDTHGSGGGRSVMYERGRGVPGEQGQLVAAFTGKHGWFWRNRTDSPVTFTLRTRGEYDDVVMP